MNPASSRASRITAIWPSIMPEGETTWAPARAWLTAIAAYSGRVASLSTRPSSVSAPQWPWLVNSSRQVSVQMTRSSPTASRTAAMPLLRIPSGFHACEPISSFSVGTPNRSIPAMPASAACSASFLIESRVCWYCPGMALISRGSVSPSATKAGSMSWAGDTRVSATMRRMAGVVRSRRGRTRGRSISGRGLMVVSVMNHSQGCGENSLGRRGGCDSSGCVPQLGEGCGGGSADGNGLLPGPGEPGLFGEVGQGARHRR